MLEIPSVQELFNTQFWVLLAEPGALRKANQIAESEKAHFHVDSDNDDPDGRHGRHGGGGDGIHDSDFDDDEPPHKPKGKGKHEDLPDDEEMVEQILERLHRRRNGNGVSSNRS